MYVNFILCSSASLTGTNCFKTTTQKFWFPEYLISSLNYITDDLLKSISFWIKWSTLIRLTLVFLSILFFLSLQQQPKLKKALYSTQGRLKVSECVLESDVTWSLHCGSYVQRPVALAGRTGKNRLNMPVLCLFHCFVFVTFFPQC